MSGWFTRPVVLAGGFLLAALLVLAGLGWATFTALEAEAGQQKAIAHADRLSRERLALWRLDGFMVAVVGRENARPFEDFTPAAVARPESPPPPWVTLHLQLDPAGGWVASQTSDMAVAKLDELKRHLPPAEAAKLFATAEAVEPLYRFTVPAPVVANQPPASFGLGNAPKRKTQSGGGIGGGIGGGFGGGGIGGLPALTAGGSAQATALGRGVELVPDPQPPGPPASNDYVQRARATESNLNNSQLGQQVNPPRAEPTKAADKPTEFSKMDAARADAAPGGAPAAGRAKDELAAVPPGVHLGPMRPVWVPAAGDQWLFLVRPVQVGSRRLYQAVWLDWPLLRGTLSDQVHDLLPAATLSPAARPTAADRALTALPAEIDPGPPDDLPLGWTPLQRGLALAWMATLLALTAVAAGGKAVVSLADRRVRFVSAVTHELRTPLTSLRLYLDLLAGGMVTDPAKRDEYISTLSGEADRLHRLIENVLDFARLERRSVRANCVPVPASDLLGEVATTWADRLAADGKELVVNSTLPPGQTLRTDPRMAGQVLANLLDNARKYSRDAADARVWLWAKPGPRGTVVFEVEDRGPGVPDRDQAGIFKAFRRGRDVDAVAGGAGLGLALAAQWAGLLGGTLAFRPADGGVGACFRLELPASGC